MTLDEYTALTMQVGVHRVQARLASFLTIFELR